MGRPGRTPDDVPDHDSPWLPVLVAHPTRSRQDAQELPSAVVMPVGACAGGEVDVHHGHALRREDTVHPDIAGEDAHGATT